MLRRMSFQFRPNLSLACTAALLIALPACPGDDSAAGSDGGTTTDGTTTDVTVGPTTTPMTTGPMSSSSDGGDSTTGSVDDTSSTATGGSTSSATEGSTGGSDSGSGSGSDSGSSSGGADNCGNDIIDAGEDCDGADIGGALCADQGFDDGVVGCDAACAFDLSGCFFVESLQNDNGACDFTELGCTDPGGTAGNPQDMLECYETTLTPPIDVTVVQYTLGVSVPLPDTADLVIHEWAGPGNLPGVLVDQIPLDPATDIVAGAYDFVLPTPVNVTTTGFCVGFHGDDAADGFRVGFSDAGAAGESYIRANLCGLAAFTEASDLMNPGNFCIRPTVTSVNP
jgi:hypothetical protein